MSREHAADHLLAECAKWHGRTQILIATAPAFDPVRNFGAQLDALVSVGILDAGEAAEWRARFGDARRRDPELVVDDAVRERATRYLESFLPHPPDEDSRAFDVAVGVFASVGILTEGEVIGWFDRLFEHDEESSADDWPEVGGPELRGVVLGPADVADGVRIVCAELYPGGVIVKWTATDMAELSLSDDAGTSYESIDADADGSASRAVRGETTFAPGVPDAATRLAVEAGGRRLEMELAS